MVMATVIFSSLVRSHQSTSRACGRGAGSVGRGRWHSNRGTRKPGRSTQVWQVGREGPVRRYGQSQDKTRFPLARLEFGRESGCSRRSGQSMVVRGPQSHKYVRRRCAVGPSHVRCVHASWSRVLTGVAAAVGIFLYAYVCFQTSCTYYSQKTQRACPSWSLLCDCCD